MGKVVDILKKIGAVITDDHFVYTSGKHGSVYINKDALYPHTAETSEVCRTMAEMFKDKDIDVVVAPAVGGTILSQWVAYHLSQLKNKEITMIDVRNYIKNNIKPKKTIAVKDVVRIVSDFYNIKEDSIYEKTRHKEVIRPRQIVMYLLREDFNISYPSIGQKLGGRDHTTVIYSCEKIKTDIKVDQSLLEEVGQIRNLLTV